MPRLPRNVQRTCKHAACSKKFYVTKNRMNHAACNYCNRSCMFKSRIGRPGPTLGMKGRWKRPDMMSKPVVPNWECQECGKEMRRTASKISAGRGLYCSKPCFVSSQAGRRAPNRKYPDTPCQYCRAVYKQRSGGKYKSPSKFCSFVCATASRIGKPSGRSTLIARNCEKCGKEFHERAATVAMGGGRFCSRKCYGLSKRGENSHWWMGGGTPERNLARGRSEYKAWRTAVYQRDNYTCRQCGIKGAPLEADHILPWSVYPDLRYEVSNGRTLCEPCHASKTKQERKIYGHMYNRSPIERPTIIASQKNTARGLK